MMLTEKGMYRLRKKDHTCVRPLFAEMAGMHLNILAVLEGNSSGEVFVDDRDAPKAAHMTFGQVHYLVGDSDNRHFNTALNAALPRDTYFVLFCDPDRWGDALDVVLANTYAIRARRCYYMLQQPKITDWRERIPGGFSMLPIDAELLERGLANSEDIVDGILSEWRSLEAFYGLGFGFCLAHDEAIASWSCADYVSGQRCEIGINTDWHYRRRGFGTLTAAATASCAVDRGFSTIGWHCWDNNVGSIGVAENVGFVKTGDYDVFINHWAAQNVSDMTQQEFKEFAEAYEREFEIRPPTSGFPHIVAAKAWALSGSQSGCYRHLNMAVDLGWLCSVEQLRNIWPELWFDPNLEQMQEWQDLARRMRA
jgi:GNAT superfamily N-acetyltransferase